MRYQGLRSFYTDRTGLQREARVGKGGWALRRGTNATSKRREGLCRTSVVKRLALESLGGSLSWGSHTTVVRVPPLAGESWPVLTLALLPSFFNSILGPWCGDVPRVKLQYVIQAPLVKLQPLTSDSQNCFHGTQPASLQMSVFIQQLRQVSGASCQNR